MCRVDDVADPSSPGKAVEPTVVNLVLKPPDVELLARTTYKLIRPFEAMVLLLQATNLIMSAINDRYRPNTLPVVYAMGALHLVLAVLVLRHPGPLTRGHAWTLVWMAMVFVSQSLIAHLLAPGDFAAFGNGVPVGNYALIPLAVFAFYPWGGFRSPRRRLLIEGLLILTIVLHPLFLLGLMHRWDLTAQHVQSVVQYGVWAVVWFLIGKGIAWLCLIAVRVETEALSHSYELALGDMHSYVETAARGIDAGQDPHDMGRRLWQVINARRRQLLFRDEQVSLVDVFDNAIRLYRDRLDVLSAPRLGGLVVPRDPAILLEQGLADLLKNVVEHGGGAVALHLTVRDGVLALDVRDNGPGLPRVTFDDPASRMQKLRRKLLARGGDLTLLGSDTDSGTALRLTLPIEDRG